MLGEKGQMKTYSITVDLGDSTVSVLEEAASRIFALDDIDVRLSKALDRGEFLSIGYALVNPKSVRFIVVDEAENEGKENE